MYALRGVMDKACPVLFDNTKQGLSCVACTHVAWLSAHMFASGSADSNRYARTAAAFPVRDSCSTDHFLTNGAPASPAGAFFRAATAFNESSLR